MIKRKKNVSRIFKENKRSVQKIGHGLKFHTFGRVVLPLSWVRFVGVLIIS